MPDDLANMKSSWNNQKSVVMLSNNSQNEPSETIGVAGMVGAVDSNPLDMLDVQILGNQHFTPRKEGSHPGDDSFGNRKFVMMLVFYGATPTPKYNNRSIDTEVIKQLVGQLAIGSATGSTIRRIFRISRDHPCNDVDVTIESEQLWNQWAQPAFNAIFARLLPGASVF